MGSRVRTELSYPDMSVFFIFLFLIPLSCSLGFPKAFKAGGLQIDLQYLDREFEEEDLNIEDAFIAHNPTDVIDEEMIQYEEIAKEEKDDLSFKSRQKQKQLPNGESG